MKEMHFKKLTVDVFGYSQTWATWSVDHDSTITIYLVEGDTALIQFATWNDATGKENNKWLTRKVKDGAIQFNGVLYLVSYPENKEVAAAPIEEIKEVNDNMVVHKVNAWNSASFSDFQFILEVDGNEFGYYMNKEENGDMKYKVVILGNDGYSKRNKVIGYESDLEGIETAVNNFLSKGFMFFMWEMKPQKVRVKVVDAMEAFVEKIKAEKQADEVASNQKDFYIELCKGEIDQLEKSLAVETNEDQKTFLKSRIENRKIELEFLNAKMVTAEKQEPKLVATYELGGILVDVFEDQTKDVPFSVTVPVPPKYSTSEHKYKSATKTFERESLERMHELMDYIGYRLVKEENGKFYIEVDSFDFDAGDVVKEKVFFDSEKPATPSHGFEMHPGYGNIPKDEVAADPVEVNECEDKVIVKNENGHHVFIFGHVYNVGYGEGQEKELTFQVFNGNSLEFRNSNNDIFLFLPKDIVFNKQNVYVEKLRSKPDTTTAEIFAICFRCYVEDILTSKHVYGGKRALEMIEELNAAYVDEKLKRRL